MKIEECRLAATQHDLCDKHKSEWRKGERSLRFVLGFGKSVDLCEHCVVQYQPFDEDFMKVFLKQKHK